MTTFYSKTMGLSHYTPFNFVKFYKIPLASILWQFSIVIPIMDILNTMVSYTLSWYHNHDIQDIMASEIKIPNAS